MKDQVENLKAYQDRVNDLKARGLDQKDAELEAKRDFETMKDDTRRRGQDMNQKPERIALDKFQDEYPDATGEQLASFIRLMKPTGQGGGSAWTNAKADALNEWKEQQKKDGKPPTADEIIHKMQEINKGGLTGNQEVKIQDQVDQLDTSLGISDKAIDVLNTHALSAGVAGRATRLAERVGNIFGSNSTDREQFMRWISQLQLNAPRLLTDSQGRPLSAEASKITDIIGGLSLGDTTANTIRSLEEIQKLYKKMYEDKMLQLGGKWKPRDQRDPAESKPSGGGNSAWEAAPVVGN